MKGTKEGLVLYLDDKCSYDELKKDLNESLIEYSRITKNHPLVSVRVHVGNRYLTDNQKDELHKIIKEKNKFVVHGIETNVITIEESERIRREEGIVSVARIVRSGQVLEVPGDLLLIGDVNPGGKVVAGGNIFILGILKGIAHAGAKGDSSAIISASLMIPTQLIIHNTRYIFPQTDGKKEGTEMECAYLNEENEIVFDRLQVLSHLRPNLTRLEGGI